MSEYNDDKKGKHETLWNEMWKVSKWKEMTIILSAKQSYLNRTWWSQGFLRMMTMTVTIANYHIRFWNQHNNNKKKSVRLSIWPLTKISLMQDKISYENAKNFRFGTTIRHIEIWGFFLSQQRHTNTYADTHTCIHTKSVTHSQHPWHILAYFLHNHVYLNT